MIVMNSGPQLSEMTTISHANVFVFISVFVFVNFFGHVMSPHHSDEMSQRSQVFRVALCMSISKVLSE